MRKILLVFLFFSPFFLRGNEIEKIKQTISERHKALLDATTDEERSGILYQLAIAYYQDQEIDQAFSYFLEALKTLTKRSSIEMEEEEAHIYQQSLNDYLARKDPVQAAKNLLLEYGEIASQNKNFIHLNFLIATAYANLGKYDGFFERFYSGYPYLYDTFLAFKTQGILYLRLAHHGKNAEERHAFQKEAFRYLTGALERNPKDPSLIKVLVFLAKEEKNEELVLSYLHKIAENKVELPRGDIYLYVREAVSLGECELGQEIIDQARSIYDYSRAISAAQEYLNHNKK